MPLNHCVVRVRQSGRIGSFFIVVKEKFQRRGIANQLIHKNLDFAQRNYNYLTLSTYDTIEYEAAIHLYNKHGFKVFYKKGDKRWMSKSFNKRGAIVCALLHYIFPIMPHLEFIFSGAILGYLYKKLLRRNTRSNIILY